MSERTKLEEAIKERLPTKTLIRNDNQLIGGGCISKCMSYTVDDEKSIFVKSNSSLDGLIMFEGEYESLRQIFATNTVKCPKPLIVLNNYDFNNSSAIVMEYFDISSLKNDCAKKLGYSLANLHDYNNKVIRFNKKASKWIGGKIPSVKQIIDKNDSTEDEASDDEADQYTKHCMNLKNMNISSSNKTITTRKHPKDSQYPDRFVPEPNTEEVLRFGFDVPTSCGSIPQVNEWTDDWVIFFARHRLDKAIREILSDHGDRELSEQWSQLQLKVNKFFSLDFPTNDDNNKIIPALLHGDLWSGNVAQISIEADEDQGQVESNEPIIYDPSSFYGHSEYEFGISRMFGGIPRTFEEAYFELMPKKKLFEKRNKLYQLFHHLNHWSHFGSGYRASSLRLIKDLNTMV